METDLVVLPSRATSPDVVKWATAPLVDRSDVTAYTSCCTGCKV